MISQNNRFPVDIFAVKEYGIDKWRNEFFCPVSDTEFLDLYRDINGCLVKQIDTQPEEIGDLLIIQRTLLFEYLNFLHALKVVNKIKGGGKDLLYSENSLWYKDIANDTLGDLNILEKARVKYGRLKKIRIEMTDFLRCLIYNIRFHKYFSFAKKKDISEVYGSVSPLMEQYIKKMPHSFHFTSRSEWLPKETFYKVPENVAKNIKEVSKTIVDELSLAADRNDIFLYDNCRIYLQQLTENAMLYAAKMLHLAKSKINRKIHLLISGLGGVFPRALYLTIRRRGGKVTSFSHGGHIGLFNAPKTAFSEFVFSDEFVTYTQKSVDFFERIKNKYSPLRDNKVNIISGESDEFLKIWQRERNKPLPKHIKRVMIIGYPYNQWRKYQAPASLSLMHMDLELRIVDLLKKAGYKILYKVHPDRIAEAEGIFENNATVLKDYFQKYVDTADAFLFGSIRTTAFSVALCTNKPIISFIMEQEPFEPFPDAMELLKKRCDIIYAKFDERNRITFDEKELLDALAKKPSQPNTEFIEACMFPEKIQNG